MICGTGALAEELKAVARTSGVEGHVTFAGLLDNATIARYDVAADAFVLPSLLEACPTVALEALASGTPVISSDNPGGLELRELFGFDVTVVPRKNPLALARAIVQLTRRQAPHARGRPELIERDYRPAAVQAQYRAIYERRPFRADRLTIGATGRVRIRVRVRLRIRVDSCSNRIPDSQSSIVIE